WRSSSWSASRRGRIHAPPPDLHRGHPRHDHGSSRGHRVHDEAARRVRGCAAIAAISCARRLPAGVRRRGAHHAPRPDGAPHAPEGDSMRRLILSLLALAVLVGPAAAQVSIQTQGTVLYASRTSSSVTNTTVATPIFAFTVPSYTQQNFTQTQNGATNLHV